MYKGKVRSMQRGAAKRDRSGPIDLYTTRPPKARAVEKLAWGKNTAREKEFRKKIRSKLIELTQAGFCKPRELAAQLSKSGLKTVTGEPWTPRLVYLMTQEIFGGSLPRESKKGRKDNKEMRSSEFKHFHYREIHVGQLCAKLEPIIKEYARIGVRKPADVSAKLNADSHRTAVGDKWTPRLTRFLLALIFNPTAHLPTSDTTSIASDTKDANEAYASPPLDRADLAQRLSALGRVVGRRGEEL